MLCHEGFYRNHWRQFLPETPTLPHKLGFSRTMTGTFLNYTILGRRPLEVFPHCLTQVNILVEAILEDICDNRLLFGNEPERSEFWLVCCITALNRRANG